MSSTPASQTALEGNRMIAEFMGWKKAEFNELYWIPPSGQWEFSAYLMYQMPFHTSWDWLMPVVEKIESLGWIFSIQWSECEISQHKETLFKSAAATKIQAVYHTVILFIEWCNTNKHLK